MQLQKLHLLNFRNYTEASLEFPLKVNVLVGLNGAGKTNLLDAIYYLSFTKSAWHNSDPLNVKHGQNHFHLRGHFTAGSKSHEISAGFQTGMRKSFREDGAEYEKMSDHIGKYPVVLIAPDDVGLVKDGNETRRKFFDGVLSQMDRSYLENLIQYNQVLKQRNGLLRMFQDGRTDWVALESYDYVLDKFGSPIFEKRKAFASEFLGVFMYYFNFLTGKGEVTDIRYKSGLDEMTILKGCLGSRKKDVALLRTSFGVHRDEYEFYLGDVDMRRFGSEGQKKSFVIALKLAQWQILKEKKGFAPILLLDDIFDKLDDTRIDRLLELIKHDLGQLFITDARPDRTRKLLEAIDVRADVFKVEGGEIAKV